jgi:hypothetical protein
MKKTEAKLLPWIKLYGIVKNIFMLKLMKENILAICVLILSYSPYTLWAQDETKVEAYDTSKAGKLTFPNEGAGEFTPGQGFDIVKTKFGSLNISLYGLARYVNQLPPGAKFTDHLGRERTINTRNDIMWHRTFVWLSGFFYKPQFRYTISLWSLPSTNQVLLFGNFQYQINKAIILGVGIGPNTGPRSMMGSWPYFMSSDRVMAEEALRPGFTSGFWITGKPLPKLNYWLMLGNNLSQLGITISQLTRYLIKSGNVWYMPTTGEFGPRGGFNDFEQHEKAATRFGFGFVSGRESRFNEISNPNPAETQIRLSDGVLLFETGSLADSVTVKNANFEYEAFDAGVKYKGLHVQTEFYRRKLSKFDTDKELSLSQLVDYGFYVQASFPIIKKKLHLYGIYSAVIDDFKRDPWEITGGMNYYPSGTRNWRVNLHVINVQKSAAGSSFGFYQGGLTGTIISVGTDILL